MMDRAPWPTSAPFPITCNDGTRAMADERPVSRRIGHCWSGMTMKAADQYLFLIGIGNHLIGIVSGPTGWRSHKQGAVRSAIAAARTADNVFVRFGAGMS